MKKIILFILGSTISIFVFASDTAKLYNHNANASKDIELLILKAKKEKKHILLQAGGNWCSWCIKFNKFTTEDKQMDSVIQKNYIVYHLNYSSENKNPAIFAKYYFPQRFGFPVFIILNSNGKQIHTQNSVYLEEGKGYSKERILDFLNSWTAASLNPNNYKE